MVVEASVVDPGSGVFLPPGSRKREPDPGYIFSESGMNYRYLFDYEDQLLKP
jgi:hypothetical protein